MLARIAVRRGDVPTAYTWLRVRDKVRSATTDGQPVISLRLPDGNGKQKDPFRRQHETWRRAYAEACSLRERFPSVEQFVVEVAFADSKELGTYSPQMRSLSASAKAFFAIACPRTLCLDGGFDLDSIIRAMLGNGETVSFGTLECQGWLDPARPEKARCLLQMHYRLQARYDATRAGTSRRRKRA